MEELEVFQKFDEIAVVTQYGDLFGGDKEKAKQIAAHKAWLQSIRHERPSTSHPFKIGVYIRYFNQTKYDNYLAYHKKQFSDSIGLCPKWELMTFSCREEAVAWICANQLGRRNLTEESRKFLIGKQYESEKVVTRKRAVIEACHPDHTVLPYETFDPSKDSPVVETKKKTAERIAEENHISHGTVEKYSLYARAIEEITKKEPAMASKILTGRYKISHEGVLLLAKRSAEELHEMFNQPVGCAACS